MIHHLEAARWATLLALAAPACTTAGTMEAALHRAALAHEPALVAIAYQDLATGACAFVHADEVMHAASTMKVPVMLELYRQAEAGERSLDADVLLENRFVSIVDGSPYSLDPADDSDAGLYQKVGQDVTVRELMHRMIARSSNLATNALIQLAGARRVQHTIEELGTTRMKVLRGVEDDKAYQEGLSNTATARDLMTILAAIARNEAASPAACEEMVEILAAQEFNDLIPAGLPSGTKVAHKTGWITGIRHDAAIVYPESGAPYVLVVLTRGFEDPEQAARAIAGMAAEVHGQREKN